MLMTAAIQHKEVREITLIADNIEEPNIPQIPLSSPYTTGLRLQMTSSSDEAGNSRYNCMNNFCTLSVALFYFIAHCIGFNSIQEIQGLTTATHHDGSYHRVLVLSELH